MLDYQTIKRSLHCGCPRCGVGSIFPHRLTLDVIPNCPACGLKIGEHDSGDGPAVFLIFILGLLLTPSALFVDSVTTIPLWAHAIIWTLAAVGLCVLTMQPLKTYVIALNYKHRGGVHGV